MKFKKVISTGMILALLLSSIPFYAILAKQNNGNDTDNFIKNHEDAAKVKNKSEVVYGALSADGAVNGLYVVNHFEVEKGGTITDFGDYKLVKNLTDSSHIIQNKDSITLLSDLDNFYYQGNMEAKDLPWDFQIQYKLDAVKLSPKEIAGKSGKVEISIKTTQNQHINPVFFKNYMLQISVSLDAKKCSNIDAPGATIAEAGNSKMLVFTVMPNKTADLIITADVNNFTMNGIEISSMPFSMSVDIPDADHMLEDLNKLPEAINELNKGVGELADGTIELNQGMKELKDGSREFRKSLHSLKNNSTIITDASTRIKESLTLISNSLGSNSSGMDMGELIQLPTALNELSKGLKGISNGLSELKNGYASAHSILDMTMQSIPDIVITEEQIKEQFPNPTKEQSSLLNGLYTSYMTSQTIKGTYEQVKEGFSVVVPTIETLKVNLDTISKGLDEISTTIDKSLEGMDITTDLTQLTDGLYELSINYESFDIGLKEYMIGLGKLSDGYMEFDGGVSTFQGGVSGLGNGVFDLYDGTNKLNEEVSKMPDIIQDEMDKLMIEYGGSDFDPVSFVSSKNEITSHVQFVIKCDGIKLPIGTTSIIDTSEEANQKETIVDRFIALFIPSKKSSS